MCVGVTLFLRDRVIVACMYVYRGEVMFCVVVCMFRDSK